MGRTKNPNPASTHTKKGIGNELTINGFMAEKAKQKKSFLQEKHDGCTRVGERPI